MTEWRGVEDIIRLSFLALRDIVKAQGDSLKELERQMPTRVIHQQTLYNPQKASKAELHAGLQQKTSI